MTPRPQKDQGRLIAVVGASGVGKDTVLTALADQMPEIQLVQRIITRAPGLPGEAYQAVSEAEFERLKAQGAFCLDWQAHGLSYGIPQATLSHVCQGGDVAVNLSRGVLLRAAEIFPNLRILHLTAGAATLAERVAHRGRETADEIARRLARQVADFNPSLTVHTISNDGPIEQTIDTILRVLAASDAAAITD